MPFFPRLSLLLIHPPKTAGRSVTEALRTLDPAPLLDVFPVPITKRSAVAAGWYNHATWREAHAILSSAAIHPGIICATIRHPLDRLVSWYHFVRQAPMFNGSAAAFVNHIRSCADYESYVGKREHFITPQSTWLELPPALSPALRLLRFESLDADWQELLAEIALSHPALPHLHETAHVGFQHLYSASMARATRDYYKDDMDLLGYS